VNDAESAAHEGVVPRALGWVVAITFVAATVIFGLLESGVTASETVPPLGSSLERRLVLFFQDQQRRLPQDIAAALLFSLGVVGLALLAILVARRLGRDDARGTIAAATIGIGATIGVVSQLAIIGVQQVTTDPRFCDCRFAVHQVIAQDRILDAMTRAQEWLLTGFLFLAAARLAGLAAVALARGAFGKGWARIAQLAALGAVVAAASDAFRADLPFTIAVVATAGILVPIWAVWTGRSLARPAAPAP